MNLVLLMTALYLVIFHSRFGYNIAFFYSLIAKEVVDAVWAIISEPFCQLIEDAINEALANLGGEGFGLINTEVYVEVFGSQRGPQLRSISL